VSQSIDPNEAPRASREPVPAGVTAHNGGPIQKLVAASLAQPMLIALVAIAIIGAGLFSLRRLPVDAYPDVSPP